MKQVKTPQLAKLITINVPWRFEDYSEHLPIGL